MDRDARAYLWDAKESAEAIARFVRSKTFEDYRADLMLHSAVERQFGIIGEALGQLEKVAPEVAKQIPELGSAVAFRNILILGYDVIDDRIVWRTIEESLPALRERLTALLNRLGNT